MTQKNGVDQIYIPPEAELLHLFTEMITKWPQLVSRAEKAKQIITEHRITYRSELHSWIAVSNRDGGREYQLQADTCSCPDYNSNFSPVAGNHRWCKHKIAISLYERALLIQIDNRLVSPTHTERAEPGTIRTDGINLYDAFQPRLICRIRRDRKGLFQFFDSRAMRQFSMWLCETAQSPVDLIAI